MILQKLIMTITKITNQIKGEGTNSQLIAQISTSVVIHVSSLCNYSLICTPQFLCVILRKIIIINESGLGMRLQNVHVATWVPWIEENNEWLVMKICGNLGSSFQRYSNVSMVFADREIGRDGDAQPEL